MDFFNQKLKMIKRKSKSYLYCAILFLILSSLCFGWAFYIADSAKSTEVTLHELIYRGSTKEKEFVNLTVIEVPYRFAEYDSDTTSPKYYFLMDENYLYIGYLDYGTYLTLNQEDIQKNPITIQGFTKVIPDDVIDIAIEVYNEELGEEFLTRDNYKSYIGEICIDTTSDLGDNVLQMILGALFLVVAIIYFIIYYSRNRKIKKIQKDTMLWEEVKTELTSSETIDYPKFGLYLTPRYIIDGFSGFIMMSYADIVWVYLYEHKYNGVTNNRYLIVVTKDKKKITVAGLAGFHSKSKDTYLEIMKQLYEKNPNMLVGYTKENQKRVKDLYQIK